MSFFYLVDIFGGLNELNLALQGYDKTIINFIDVLSAFQAKLQLWERKMTKGKTGMFPARTCGSMIMSNRRLSINNLQSLRSDFAGYFPNITRDDLAFVRNPNLIADADLASMFNGDDNTQEEFIALTNDSTTKDVFKEKNLSTYW
ncbi:zinc finger BED domain-containing protein 5-like [Clavelina lepadiformis]|uniref:zinc finger BED domain-containing protein 5-like n=1 Tax=Clavelina lepadiformis TaxID=159417 RepID=UPI004042563E